MSVTLHVKQAKSFTEKTFGLIFYKKPTSMLFKTRFGIHTFGMRYAIDVIVLDKKQIVVKLKKNLHPNRIYLWPVKFDTVIELPAGMTHELNISNGTTITLQVD